MEFEVKHVGGIENCFVSLPLQLIQTLESTRPDIYSQVLSLELRSSSSDRLWTVAWSGATSSSSSVEVARQFADCIALPDRMSVQVRVVTNVANATLVTIEPSSEDDWEVMELNAKQAEAAILKQVRTVHEAMKFPLWLHGHTIITFLVVSTFPKKPVVQLVPGTEVAVAPKRRKKDAKKQDTSLQFNKENNVKKVPLRLQDSDRRFLYKHDVNGLELGVSLTSVAYMHPETANKFALDSLQLVIIMPRLSLKEGVEAPESDVLGMKTAAGPKEVSNRSLSDKEEVRQAIVRLLFSDSVAKGHLMIARSLRLYLRTGLHSWIYLRECRTALKEDIAMLSLSPCYLKIATSSPELPDNIKTQKPRNTPSVSGSGTFMDAADRSAHYKFVAALSSDFAVRGDEETINHSDNKKGLVRLLCTWFLTHLDFIAAIDGVEVNSLILGTETLVHFEVKGHEFEKNSEGKPQALSNTNGSPEKRNKAVEVPLEFLFLLTVSEQSPHKGKNDAYRLDFDDHKKDNLWGKELLGKLKWADPVYIYYPKERTSTKGFSSNVSSLSWMRTTAEDVINRITLLLSPISGMWFSNYNLRLPGHVLIYGPHVALAVLLKAGAGINAFSNDPAILIDKKGSGKTILVKAVGKSLQEHQDLLAHIVFVDCSRLAAEKASTTRQALSAYISEAVDHAPSLVIFDDLDSIVASSSDPEGSQASSSIVALTKFLTDIMDEYGEKRKSSCGIGPIAFIACVKTLDSIPQSLTSSGRFDFHVQLPAPSASERGAILKHEVQRRSLQCSDEILLDVASKCDGYDAYDLEILVDRAVHAAVGRFLPYHSSCGKYEIPSLIGDDFSHAMHEFLPVAMRDITTSAPKVGHSGWDDVGGLGDIQKAIKEMIELPSKFPNIFGQAPLRLRSNVLLYGPPGCGKTHIVGATAAACSLRFISVKGPELLNKYIGASEQAVRDIFSKAAAAAPCLLFFDEFDSIAPKRGHDNTGVTDRVVNQFLTELDGVEVLTGVFVFAATSRPDLLDAALLRPGRLDRLLFCDFPSAQERLDILAVLSRKLPLATDVDLDAIANMAEGFSGADLQALLSDAQLAAVHEHLNDADRKEPGKMPVITDALLKSVASKARPSVSESEKQRLYDIYSQFQDSKKSATAQPRDAKGKRATLA